jgi:hypothetical protein
VSPRWGTEPQPFLMQRWMTAGRLPSSEQRREVPREGDERWEGDERREVTLEAGERGPELWREYGKDATRVGEARPPGKAAVAAFKDPSPKLSGAGRPGLEEEEEEEAAVSVWDRANGDSSAWTSLAGGAATTGLLSRRCPGVKSGTRGGWGGLGTDVPWGGARGHILLVWPGSPHSAHLLVGETRSRRGLAGGGEAGGRPEVGRASTLEEEAREMAVGWPTGLRDIPLVELARVIA